MPLFAALAPCRMLGSQQISELLDEADHKRSLVVLQAFQGL